MASKGYAPGSWSQVAKDRTGPKGLVVGIDLIPAQPPRGVSTIQGNFLSPSVRDLVKSFVAEGALRKREQQRDEGALEGTEGETDAAAATDIGENGGGSEGREGEAPTTEADDVVLVEQTSYIDAERIAARDSIAGDTSEGCTGTSEKQGAKKDRFVDVRVYLPPTLWPPLCPDD